MKKVSGHLLHNLILFGRVLHGIGLDINPGRMIDLVNALDYIEIGRRIDFYFATRGLLVHRREDIPLFDEAFRMFWVNHDGSWKPMNSQKPGGRKRSRRPTFIPPPLKAQTENNSNSPSQKGDASNTPPIVHATLTYSAREVLRHKNFAELTGEELQTIERIMNSLTWRLGMRRTRRLRSGSGSQIDMRRTLRNNLKYGGEVLEWAQREPKFKPRPLVIIADISGSMERYTRILLQFIYSLTYGLNQKVEAFVFSTRLTRITFQLEEKNVEEAIGQVSNLVLDWSGGTRIVEALKSFNFEWGRRVLGQGAVVLLISDGWDRGDPGLLRTEIARLQRSCYRLIWLNPLLGDENYEPLTIGMRTALPFVDHFLPIHNLASLEDLSTHLARFDQARPTRRQLARSYL
jgi:uncharacterized protein with von Willebrand factor type A (vWA) domain